MFHNGGVNNPFKLPLVMKNTIVNELYEFLDNEARSCSMDFACVTPLYVYRMWGGAVALEEIAEALQVVKNRIW